MSTYERTGWRDSWISLRHRMWGKDCPMIDVDAVWVEYDSYMPRLLVEYKREDMGRIEEANYRCLVNLAALAALPALGVRYWPNEPDGPPTFQVTSLNDTARAVVDAKKLMMTEMDYVELLYRFRGRAMPADLRRLLANEWMTS